MRHLAILALATCVAAPAGATTLRVSITNAFASDGFALTPIYSAFHDGAFDSYDIGAAATPGLELLAELGDPSGLPAERLAASPGSTAGVVFGGPPGMPRPIFGGETAFADIEITDTASQRFFSFLSMVVPTNDTFIGNGNPMAYEIFDAAGAYLGDRTISITGAQVRDAGTEVNDPADGPAFAAGVDATGGTAEGGTVQEGFGDLGLFAGLPTAAGFTIDPGLALLLDGIGNPAEFEIGSLTITEIGAPVAPIPLPAGAWLLLGGIAAIGAASRRRRPSAR